MDLKEYCKNDIFMVEQVYSNKVDTGLKSLDDRITDICSTEDPPIIINPTIYRPKSNFVFNTLVEVLKTRT